MSVIGRLAVAVLGDISNLKQSFGEVKKEARGLKQDLKSIDGELRAVSRSMVMMGTVIVGSMTAMVLKSTQAANAADKLAKQTGLTREQVQELGYAADQEHASLEELAKSINRLSRNMLTSTQGTNEAQRAFKSLGIDVKDANGNLRSSVDVLLDIADRFKDMTNETEMSAIAMQLLGRSGADIVPFLRMGGDEIRKLTQEARDLGYVMDEETVKGLKRLDDQLTATKAGFAGIGRQITADVLPGYLKLADAAVDFFKWLNQTNPELRSAITQITALGGVMALLSGSVFLLYLNLKKAAVAAAALNIAFKPFLIGGAILAGLGAIGVAFLNIRDNARLAKTEVQDLADAELDREEKRLRDELERKRDELARQIQRTKNLPAWQVQRGEFTSSPGAGYVAPEKAPDTLTREIQLLEERLDKLIKEREAREKAAQAASDQAQREAEVADILEKMKNELDAVVPLAKIFGTENEIAARKAAIFESAIRSLREKGVDPHKTSMGDLVAQYQHFADLAEEDAKKERLKSLVENYNKTVDRIFKAGQAIATIKGEMFDQEKALTALLQAQEQLMEQYILEGLSETSEEYRQLAQEIQKTVAWLKEFQQAQTDLAEEDAKKERLKSLVENYNKTVDRIFKAGQAIATIKGEMFDQEKALTALLQAQEQLMEQYILEGLSETSEEYRQLAQEIQKTVAWLKEFQQAQKDAQAAQQFIRDDFLRIKKEWYEGVNTDQSVDKAIADALSLPFDEVQAQIDATIQAIQNTAALRDEEGNPIYTVNSPGIQNYLQFLQYLRSIQKSEFDIMLDNMGDWSLHMKDIAQTTAESMAEMFSDFFFNPLEFSMTNFLNRIRRAIADVLGQTFTSFILKSIGFSPESLGNIFGGGRATGGPVTAGVVYRVNEREPEFFKPRQSGEVVPLSKMGMVADVDVIIENQTGVPVKVQKQNVTIEGHRIVARLLMQAMESNTEGITDILKGTR